MLGLQQLVGSVKEVRAVAKGIENEMNEQLLTGLTGSARTVVSAALFRETGRSQLVVTHNLYQAQKIYEDLVELLDEDTVYLYPVNELISAEIAVASPEMKAQRLDLLNALVQDFKGIVVAPLAGIRRLLPPKALWQSSQLHLKTGEDIGDLEEFIKNFVTMGYRRSDMVSAPGEFSVRGGIVDLYPLTKEHPLRIELFDTEVDSMRYFSLETQRSEGMIDEVTIGPAQEVLLHHQHYSHGAKLLEEKYEATLKKVSSKQTRDKLQEHIPFEIAQLKQSATFEGMYKYMSLYYETPQSLLSYMPENAFVWVDEMNRVKEMAEHLQKEEAEWHTAMLEQGSIVHGTQLSLDALARLQQAPQPVLYTSLFQKQVPSTKPEQIINLSCKSMQNFHGQMDLLTSEVNRWLSNDYTVLFIAGTEDRANRLALNLEDEKIDAHLIEAITDLTPGKVQIYTGHLHTGFELSEQKLVVVTEEEVFSKRAKRPKRRQKLSNAERIKSYSELAVGDLVVHTNHGVGKYLGVETLEINGVHKDYLNLRYAGNDKLYVPVEQIDQVQKYVGTEEKDPKIYALGGSDWKKVKKKVQSSVEDIADDLIKLYAEREASVGHRFSPDGPEQAEFESSFPYQETEDQLRAIKEIKEDMEKQRPMDRLLCGDVGYGKTEVAIRAAFKAIMDGKQVAILVPTTILAQQHFETISERFSDFPITVGVLSRFRSRKEQTEVLKGLKAGSVDLVVGTHRLLSKDVQFKDLGLLIVDEEQRFGVTHKEKIKRMKANIDVLTLTATPIPRTLHMSMLGVRDLSVIETPPENRFPVQTYVVEFNPAIVREAIERELSRGGQVYVLYNRVEDIERMTEQISTLVPDARVSYAHGQMNERELESIILDFLEGESDVLVTTTIIETGVDIPNVNTLIVCNADKMGLSQLYQIRGRVGRSNRVAYSYFTYQPDKVLTEVAEKRLQAIKEFTELGSGFKIAMRDLTIRGAGNLLGSQQHGFIDSVGFDLYSQMLKEAIEERKGEKPKEPPFKAELNVNIDAYIPERYIPDAKQKIEMYKRFKGVETLEEIADLQDELVDRFGEYPKQVAYLFEMTKIKLIADQEKVEKITEGKDAVTILLTEETTNRIHVATLVDAAQKIGRDVSIGSQGSQIKLVIKTKQLSDETLLAYIIELLEALIRADKSKKAMSAS
ncbi:transcription-repair coupling factor [Niallia circulans]|jgi:transcription-repair coupling factor (superfamily II helicase)|uniref:transcription-repair coupling factor n=1 Tax=Shouchella clausii TaxID=79880 RepID=UPI000B9698B6|nr:transcription-repair coupling factor [Shouchella clausii]SPU18532.1 transcription-repair coupling factor [Niallia circulans]AST95559.1 transcription-repair coupling factor [Shouchella clausii]MCM3550275.1 transcription-repair coupling factor [Shouchella clausii]MEB5472334.1 transcription-repair coupling factor [Shouchella clausii]QNM41916.1 transcription-repair coupling factor [Shouchella clausii]